ncbi:MAG: hypothetical protein MMC23_009686 [Stictis urceolatum]|nr:hypothetical protein [Stictis urceolata]
MSKGTDKPEESIGSPPAYPPPVHQDAGPAPMNHPSPYNAYGGFNNPSYTPSQAHLDPRGEGNYNSPHPGGFQSPMPPQGYNSYHSAGPYGPPVPQQGYYGPPGPQQGMYYGPPQGGPGSYGPYGPGPQGPYYGGPGQGYRGYGQYERDRGAGEGVCAGIFGALACCCCLDLLI